MYGKLENGSLIVAPSIITLNGKVHYHPRTELYEQLGYLEVVDTPYPETDPDNPKYYEFNWVEENGKIVKVWNEAEPPEPEPYVPTIEDKVAELSGRVSANEQGITDLELASAEIYEMLGGIANG